MLSDPLSNTSIYFCLSIHFSIYTHTIPYLPLCLISFKPRELSVATGMPPLMRCSRCSREAMTLMSACFITAVDSCSDVELLRNVVKRVNQ